MAQPGDTRNRRRRRIAVGILAAVTLLGAAAVAARILSRPQPTEGPRWTPEHTVTLTVEAFQALDPKPRSWTAGTVAESLSARLGHLPGLQVHFAAAASSGADFTLRGDVTAKDGRMVIAARLYRSDERQPLWTATFWRADEPSPNLIADLAADVAEALYGHLGRSAISTTGGNK